MPAPLVPAAILLAKVAAGIWLENEVRKLVLPTSVGTNTDKVPRVSKDPPSSNVNINNYNTQNNSYNYTRIQNTNTNIFQNTNNINVTIPPLPTRNLPQTLTTGGSSNTAFTFANTVKKSLANRRYGSLLANPFYEGEESIVIYTDLTEDTFLEAIEQQVYSYNPPVLNQGEAPDALEVATAFISFNDQGFAVPVFSLKIINQISSYYSSASKTSGFDVTGLINLSPITFENVGNTSTVANYPPFVTDFSGNANLRSLWELLGYEEDAFKSTSIAQVISDFREKIYDSDNDPVEIGENFTTAEQFIAGIASILLGSNDSMDEKLWDLLGYSENAFKNISIEDLMNDFKDKIYDGQNIREIDNNFRNLPQLLVGVVSSLFYREGLDRLPVEVEIDSNTIPFNSKLEYLEHLINQPPQALKIWELLGYEEDDFKEANIEQIINDFLGKAYDSDNDPVEIGENFNTLEQFLVGSIATLFYREGLSKFPIEVDLPDNKTMIIRNSIQYLEYLLNSGESFKIWESLGYEETEFKQKNIEEIIKDFGNKIYLNKPLTNINDNVLSDIGSNFENLAQLLVGIGASLFYRQGLHRLPGQLPESLTLDKTKYPKPEDQPTIFIEDAIEYQEYLLKNLDAIFGQFPINFKVKIENDQGQPEEKEVNFPNISETLTEIIGTLIGVSKDSDTAVAIGIKNLIETAKCSNLALTAVDTARSNAEYLGYKSKDIERTVLVPFDPNAKSLKDFLKDTELKITSFDNVDDDTLESQLKLLSVAAQITKSALAQRKTFITGDGIKERRQKDKEKYDDNWEKLKEKYDGSTTQSKIPTPSKPFPNVKIRDKSTPNQPPTP